MQHACPDVGAQATYDAARALLDELAGFLPGLRPLVA
jgi:hypothetical protein